MAAETRNLPDGAGWSRADIVALVTLLTGVPAVMVAVLVIRKYYRRRSQGSRGETLFFSN
jgi:hypothetical protein